MRLKDKVILVTASTRGIGLAIVKKCAVEGARVYMAARNIDRAQEIANTLDGVKCVYNDATKPETFASMVNEVVADTGHIDVLVNKKYLTIPIPLASPLFHRQLNIANYR